VYETMEASEMLLLPDLKRQCGIFLASYLETGNVVDLLRTARLFDIPRLEHQCIEFTAKNIEEVSDSPT
jgi:ankyrin repeat/BTB/POZ domain-containing protein 1